MGTFRKFQAKDLKSSFKECGRRFRLPLIFLTLLTVLCIFILYTNDHHHSRLYYTLVYYFSTGILLSTGIQLWSEEVNKGKALVNIILHSALIANAVYVYYCYTENFPDTLTQVSIVGLLLMGMIHGSLFREKNDIPASNLALHIFGVAAISLLGSLVVAVILNCLIYSLRILFDISIDYRVSAVIDIICCITINLSIVLCFIPSKEKKHNTTPYFAVLALRLAQFAFMPISVLYLIVLYCYAGKILLTFTLPCGGVTLFVAILMLAMVIIEFLIYPGRMKEYRNFEDSVAKYLPLAVLPLLVLMSIGIGRRFYDYGITAPRLYLLAFNVWCYAVCIWLFVTNARRVHFISISFAVLFFLTSVGPWRFYTVSERILTTQVKGLIARGGFSEKTLPINKEKLDSVYCALPKEDAKMLSGKLTYLYYNTDSISKIIDKDVSVWNYRYIESDRDSTGEGIPANKEEVSSTYFHFNQDTIPIPQGYRNMEVIYFYYTDGSAVDGVLQLKAGIYMTEKYVDELFEKRKRNEVIEQIMLPCKDSSNVAVFNEFSIIRHDDGKYTVDCSGYLFHK